MRDDIRERRPSSAESLQMAPARRGSRERERGRRHTRRSRGPLRGYTEVACERVAVIQMGRQMEGGLGRQMEKQKRRPRLAQLRGVAALRASPRGARRRDPARLARARLTRTRFGRVASTSASSAASARSTAASRCTSSSRARSPAQLASRAALRSCVSSSRFASSAADSSSLDDVRDASARASSRSTSSDFSRSARSIRASWSCCDSSASSRSPTRSDQNSFPSDSIAAALASASSAAAARALASSSST
mmetsp:Transcript_38949/g.125776  ORF Transcript_38949/g.125776 Transcript_38949/m.125776 type:complete len:250 (-) Transcript_38949:492-1241(-)